MFSIKLKTYVLILFLCCLSANCLLAQNNFGTSGINLQVQKGVRLQWSAPDSAALLRKDALNKSLFAGFNTIIGNRYLALIWITSALAGIIVLSCLLTCLYKSSMRKQYLQAKQIRILQQQQEIGYLKATMQGEEKERARIARELHDGIGGMLAATQMQLNASHHRPEKPFNKSDLLLITKMLETTADEVRKTAHNLIPDILYLHSLSEALHSFCDPINNTGNLHIDLQLPACMERIEKFAELSIYRIIQELVQNIIKHAQATTATIQLRPYNGKLSLMVEDNGIGFDHQENTEGHGIMNVYSRVKVLSGFISIDSSKGQGTVVCIEFDIEKLQNEMIL